MPLRRSYLPCERFYINIGLTISTYKIKLNSGHFRSPQYTYTIFIVLTNLIYYAYLQYLNKIFIFVD